MDGYMSETKDGFYLYQIEDYMKYNYILKLIKKKYDCKVIQSISNSQEGLEDISIDNLNLLGLYWMRYNVFIVRRR